MLLYTSLYAQQQQQTRKQTIKATTNAYFKWRFPRVNAQAII